MQKRFDHIVSNGRPVQGLSVAVLSYPSGTAATIYSDDGVTVAANPLTTDANGYFSYYAADGRYSWRVSGSGYTTRDITDILHEDPVNANAATFTTLTATGQVSLGGAAGAEGLQVLYLPNTSSRVSIQGAQAGAIPAIYGAGNESDIPIIVGAKGAASLFLFGNNATVVELNNPASAVNYLQVRGAAAGGPVVISAQGSDTNIDVSVTPKGAGVLRFGTFTGSGDVAINGYVNIKTADGTTRKLATIA